MCDKQNAKIQFSQKIETESTLNIDHVHEIMLEKKGEKDQRRDLYMKS